MGKGGCAVVRPDPLPTSVLLVPFSLPRDTASVLVKPVDQPHLPYTAALWFEFVKVYFQCYKAIGGILSIPTWTWGISISLHKMEFTQVVPTWVPGTEEWSGPHWHDKRGQTGKDNSKGNSPSLVREGRKWVAFQRGKQSSGYCHGDVPIAASCQPAVTTTASLDLATLSSLVHSCDLDFNNFKCSNDFLL